MFISTTWWLHMKNQFRNFVKPYHEKLLSKHGQCDSIIFPLTFYFKGSKKLPDLCLDGRRILYFWYVLEYIFKFIIKLRVLQCLFVSGSNKMQGGLLLFQISQKERLFFVFYDNQALLRVISQYAPLPAPSSCLDTQSKAALADSFWKLLGYCLFLRVGIEWWTYF